MIWFADADKLEYHEKMERANVDELLKLEFYYSEIAAILLRA
jgi:hypothetical protein